MDRRSFVGASVLGLAVGAREVAAKDAQAPRRIGCLVTSDPITTEEMQETVAPLRRMGWVAGKNLTIHWRFASGKYERLAALAAELLRLDVEIIVTYGTPATHAAKSATATIPILMAGNGDPVGSGLVVSLSRPGGNVTGCSFASPELEDKGLALLREALPSVSRVGVLMSASNSLSRFWRTRNEPSYYAAGMRPIVREVTSDTELEDAIAELAGKRAEALVVQGDQMFLVYRVRIMTAALKWKLATLANSSDLLEAGGMIGVYPDEQEQSFCVASLVDKILRGAKPADLPVEEPTRFEMTVNRKTARAIGISIPTSLLARADHVID